MDRRGLAISSLLMFLLTIVVSIGVAYKLYDMYRSTKETVSTISNPTTQVGEFSNSLLVLPNNPGKIEHSLLVTFQSRGLISDFKFIDSVTAEDLLRYDKIYVVCTDCSEHTINMFLSGTRYGKMGIFIITPYFHDYAFIVSSIKGYGILKKEGFSIENSETSFSVNEYNTEYSTVCVETHTGKIAALVLDMDIDVGFDHVLTYKDLNNPKTLDIKSAVIINPHTISIKIENIGTIRIVGGKITSPITQDNVKYIYIYIYNNRLNVYADGARILTRYYVDPIVTIKVDGSADYILYSPNYILFENMYPLYTENTACLFITPLQNKIGVQTIYAVKTRVSEGSYRNKVYLTLTDKIYGMLAEILYDGNTYKEYVFFVEGVGEYEIVGFGEIGKSYVLVPKFKNIYIIPGSIAKPDNPLFAKLILEK